MMPPLQMLALYVRDKKQQIIDERVHNPILIENTTKKLPWDSLHKT